MRHADELSCLHVSISEWHSGHTSNICSFNHEDFIKWKHFPRYWPFVRGIHRSAVNYPHKGQWRGALMFSFICDWINVSVNNREAGDLRRHRAHCDAIVMISRIKMWIQAHHGISLVKIMLFYCIWHLTSITLHQSERITLWGIKAEQVF